MLQQKLYMIKEEKEWEVI
jgi:hypothetical protein